MSKIADFKQEVTAIASIFERNIRRRPELVKSSLVGATMIARNGGREPTQFVYSDGRVCSHPDGERHDCDYVRARNRLIPRAEANALAIWRGRTFSTEAQADMSFAQLFMAEMTRLWGERP